METWLNWKLFLVTGKKSKYTGMVFGIRFLSVFVFFSIFVFFGGEVVSALAFHL
jgi:hypothetical protein